MKWSRILWGSWAQKPFCPPFLVFRKWASFSLHGLPEFQGAGSEGCRSRKGGDEETRKERSRNNSFGTGFRLPLKRYTKWHRHPIHLGETLHSLCFFQK